VSEILPAGWDQDSAVCSDNSNPSSISLGAGETVTCVFTNLQRGSISGYKYNDLNGDGVNDSDWSPVSGWIIELWQGQTYITQTTTNGSGFYSFTNLINGVYTLIEQIASGWTNITSTTLGVTLTAGENDQNNNFVNTQYGEIIVQKQTLPDGSRQSFEFDPSYNNSTNFFLSDGQSNNSGDLYPGTYSVAELTPDGWDLTGVTCSDGSTPTSISVSSGETVTCIFTNTQRGHIIIEKDAVPDNSQEFTFNNNFGNGNPSAFGLVDDSTTGLPSFDAEVLPGKYSVSEDEVAGWKTDSIVCNNGETYDDIDVAAGETVTCTFTNEKLASITLVKNTVGGNGDFDFDATGTGLPTDIDLTTVAGTASQTFENLDPDNLHDCRECSRRMGLNLSKLW
jgi:plastocyanin